MSDSKIAEGITERLEAILAADAAGYSRLMGEDERATVATLNAYRAVFRERVEAHHGRVVDMAGDSVLAVFTTANGAVEAAVEIQKELGARNAELPKRRRMAFRIGVNLGDIIEQEDGTVYGDGVNIAGRLQSIGEPGGVCFSGPVYDQSKASCRCHSRSRVSSRQEHRQAGGGPTGCLSMEVPQREARTGAPQASPATGP